MKYQSVIDDLNSDIAKLSEHLTAIEDQNVQDGLFKLLRILKSWRRVLTATRRSHADDTEAPV